MPPTLRREVGAAGGRMYQHILVATEGSPWSDAAVAYAMAIAARTGATLRLRP